MERLHRTAVAVLASAVLIAAALDAPTAGAASSAKAPAAPAAPTTPAAPAAPDDSLPAAPRGGPYWPGWDIASGVAMLPDGTGGYVLDGWGGLHPFAVGTNPMPPYTTGGPYWPGWDIARGVVMLPDGTGGYVLDGWGGLHPFALGTNPMPPYATTFPYWPGWDIARGLALLPDGESGYLVDGWGGLHPFAVGGAAPPTVLAFGAPYWPGVDRAQDVALLADGSGGYVIDGFGNLWDFGLGWNPPPGRPAESANWGTWDIARGVSFLPNEMAYTLDGWGGIHGDSVPSLTSTSYTFLATDVEGRPFRYNPCAAIHYVINPANAPAGAVDNVHSAISRLSNATGISFVYDGTTAESPTTERSSYQPDRYGERWAPVIVAWSSPAKVPELAGSVVGIGGASARLSDDGWEYVSGLVIIDYAGMEPYAAGFGPGYTQGDVLLHELGHVVGLGHVNDIAQIMYPSLTSNVAELGLGDRAGLVPLGRTAGCMDVPPLPNGPAARAGAGSGGDNTTIILDETAGR